MTEEETYNRLLSTIRNNSPLPEDPEELTKDIMRCIKRLPQQEKKKNIKLLHVVGWFSTIASVFFICFFMKELFVTDAGVKSIRDISQGKNTPILIEPARRNDIQTSPSKLNLAEKSESFFPLRKNFREKRLTQRLSNAATHN